MDPRTVLTHRMYGTAYLVLLACMGLVCIGIPSNAQDGVEGPISEEPVTGQPKPVKSKGEKPRAEKPERKIRPSERLRWEDLSPEEKERLRKVYQSLQALPKAERERLMARLRTMTPEDRRKAVQAALERLRTTREGAAAGKKGLDPPRDAGTGPEKGAKKKQPRAVPPPGGIRPGAGPRSALDHGLPAEKEKKMEKSLGRWMDRLPPVLKEKMCHFTRRECLELFIRWRESEILQRAFPEAVEREDILSLPPGGIKGLGRPDAQQPAGISPESWQRWRALKPMERQFALRRLDRLREERESDLRAADAAANGKPEKALRSETQK